MKNVVAIVGIMLFGALNFIGLSQYQSPAGLGFGSPGDLLSVVLPLGSAMLAGIIASAIVSALKQLPQDQAVRITLLGPMLLRPNTFIALLVSPVVFYGVLVGLGDGDVGPLLYLAAFQNGFFWQTALVLPGTKVPN